MPRNCEGCNSFEFGVDAGDFIVYANACIF